MNFFGIATGTDTYALSVSERSELRPGDIVTVVFLHDNTGASTLNVNGFGPVPLLRNASAMSAGDLVASTTYQFCYTGASFVQDVQASAGATTDASLLTSGTLAAARLPSNINAASIANGTVDNTEFQTLNGVTSNIQNQLDNKAALSHSHAASDITSGTIATARLGSGTADSTTFLCGDQTYKTVSATNSLVGCQAYKSNGGGDQSVSAATFTTVTFDSETFDSGAIHSTSSNTGRFVAPSDGYYFFSFAVTVTGGASVHMYMGKNGSQVSGTTDYIYSGGTFALRYAALVYLTAGEYVTGDLYADNALTVKCRDAFNGRGTEASFFKVGV